MDSATKKTSEPLPERPWLTNLQHKLVTAALVCLSLFVIALLLFGVLLLLRSFVTTFANVLWPLAVAGILALLLRPIARFLETRVRFSRIGSIALIYGLIILICAAIIAFLIPVLVEQSIRFARELPVLADRAQASFEEQFPQVIEFLEEKLGADRLDQYAAQISAAVDNALAYSLPAMAHLGSWLMAVFAWSAAAAIVPVYLFFFLL